MGNGHSQGNQQYRPTWRMQHMAASERNGAQRTYRHDNEEEVWALGWVEDISGNSTTPSTGDSQSQLSLHTPSKRRRSKNKALSPEVEEFFDSMEDNIRRKQNGSSKSLPGPEPEPLQWSNFIGGTLNHVSREHKPHYLFRTTPYMDIKILYSYMKKSAQRAAKLPIKRRNSTSSVELCLLIDDLDVQGMIKVTCLVLHHHICEGCAVNWYIDRRFSIFNDLPEMDIPVGEGQYTGWPGVGGGKGVCGMRQGCNQCGNGSQGFGHDSGMGEEPPTYDEVLRFFMHVYKTAQLEKDCVIMSLVYIERVLTETAGRLRICRRNWRSIVLAGLILASKIWDDLSMWNCDFSRVGRLPLRRINELEVAVLQVLQYNVRVASSLFASYYFRLRHWMMIVGVETPGLYEAKPPKRMKAGQCLGWGDGSSSRSGLEGMEMLNIAGGQSSRKQAHKDHKPVNLCHAPYRNPCSKLPPSLEELVHMQQTDAGGRLVHPGDFHKRERQNSISQSIRGRQKNAALQNLILAEVGDVRAKYYVSDNPESTNTSKVDLTATAKPKVMGSMGSVLGVGISGVVQVVRHKITGVDYAMKTIRLGRLQDFNKADELRNEVLAMAQLNHPNICRLLEIHESPTRDSICLILELCTGGELLTRLNKLGHYSEMMCSELARKMLSAVRHCHAHGICHRDLKLENWVYESPAPDAELKLIDFGLSTHFGKDEVMHVPVGTPYTIAPECLSGAYTQACDLWSLGVLVFMLLTGEPPFTGRDDFEVLAAVKAAKWSWGRGVIVSPDAKDFVSRLLVLDPAKRLTAEEALRHRWLQAAQPKPELPNQGVMASLQAFESLCTIKKLVLQMIAYTLEAWQVESLRYEFQKLDKDCNGLITLHDLRAALDQVGLLSSGKDSARLGEMFANVSGPGQAGVLRYNDFLAASLMTLEEHQTLDESILQAAFSKFDCGHVGRITGHDLRHFLGKELDDDDIDQMLRDAGLDHGGSMNFEEFKGLMRTSLTSSSTTLYRAESCPLPAS